MRRHPKKCGKNAVPSQQNLAEVYSVYPVKAQRVLAGGP